MECPKGSICTESTHEVKTLAKALEWFPSCLESHLPLTINTYKAHDGRLQINIYSKGRLIHKRG